MIDIYHLPDALPDEQLVFSLRRHPITISGTILSGILLVLLPVFGAGILWAVHPEITSDPVLFPLIIMAVSVFFLFAWLFLFQSFIDYYLDMWIVTTRRILNIEQHGMFARTVSELRLYRIQDVTSTVDGALHTFLDFGDVEIETAAEKTHFVFEDIKHPNLVSKRILELSEQDRRLHVVDMAEDEGTAGSAKKTLTTG